MEGLLAVVLIYYGYIALPWYAAVAWPRSQARVDFWRLASRYTFRMYIQRETKVTTRLMEYCESKYFAGTETTANPTPITKGVSA